MKKDCICDSCLFLLESLSPNAVKLNQEFYCMYPTMNQYIKKDRIECDMYLPKNIGEK